MPILAESTSEIFLSQRAPSLLPADEIADSTEFKQKIKPSTEKSAEGVTKRIVLFPLYF